MSTQQTKTHLGQWLAIAASVVVVLTLAAALWLMGSPSAQRDVNLDARRISDLSRIERLLNDHMSIHEALPPDLATLADAPGRRLSIADPVDGTPYGYEITGERTYRLCAVFVTDTAETRAETGVWRHADWAHGKGHQCFDRKLPSDLAH